MYYIYIDEAGRGPIAGPVYVGLIIEKVKISHTVWDVLDSFPAQDVGVYQGYKDSKILSEGQRNSLYKHIIQDSSIVFSSSKVSAGDIDNHGIVRALRNAILRAIHKHFVGGIYSLHTLKQRLSSIQFACTLVVDGPSDFGLRKTLGIAVIPVVDGDALVPMISCASIIAKVERDAYMYRLAKRYPHYSFHLHKGYGTAGHYAAIQQYGICKEHRKTYIHNR